MKKRTASLLIAFMGLAILAGMIGVVRIRSGESMTIMDNVWTETDLNDRQEYILQKEKLPANPDDLANQQLESIRLIEEMMQYMEKKYRGRSFSYKNFSIVETGRSMRLLLTAEDVFDDIVVQRRIRQGKVEINDSYPMALKSSEIRRELCVLNQCAELPEGAYYVKVSESHIYAEVYWQEKEFKQREIGTIAKKYAEYFAEKQMGEDVTLRLYLVKDSMRKKGDILLEDAVCLAHSEGIVSVRIKVDKNGRYLYES